MSCGAGDRWALAMTVSGSLVPGEWPAAVVPGGDEALDGGDQFGDGGEAAAAQRLAGDDREERLYQVQPGPRGRCELQLHPRMALEPGPHRGVLVRGEVVDHHVQLAARIGGGDLAQEGQELLVPMA